MPKRKHGPSKETRQVSIRVPSVEGYLRMAAYCESRGESMTDVVVQGVVRDLQGTGALGQMPRNLRVFAGNVKQEHERELLQYFSFVVLDRMKPAPIGGLLRSQLLHKRIFLQKHLEPLVNLYPQMGEIYKWQNPYPYMETDDLDLGSSNSGEVQPLTIRLPFELHRALEAHCKSTREKLSARVARDAMRGLQEAERLPDMSCYLRAFAGSATKEQERELFSYFCLVVLDQMKEEQLQGFPRRYFLQLRTFLWESLEPLRYLYPQAAKVYMPRE